MQVLLLFKKSKSISISSHNSFIPSVTVITSICNENNEVILKTLSNRLALEYPQEMLDLLFVADGSSQTLVDLLESKGVGRVRVAAFARRFGKTEALNRAMETVDSEIVVFSDANSLYRLDAINKLVRHFVDPQTGAVCGELQYVDEELPDMTGKLSNVYMDYEQQIKRAESAVSTLTVFNGAIYALRRALHQEMNPQAANDFQHPMQVVLQGYRSVYEPEAVAYENTVKSDLIEFKRTIRITARGWKGFMTYPQILNPFKTGWFCIQFLFRKPLRWLSPIFLLTMLVSSALLIEVKLFEIFFYLQVTFYLTALAGWLLRKQNLRKLIYYPYYFCLVNLAALNGFIIFLLGRNTATWKPSGEEYNKLTQGD